MKQRHIQKLLEKMIDHILFIKFNNYTVNKNTKKQLLLIYDT